MRWTLGATAQRQHRFAVMTRLSRGRPPGRECESEEEEEEEEEEEFVFSDTRGGPRGLTASAQGAQGACSPAVKPKHISSASLTIPICTPSTPSA
jgi:hypothetical protein